MANDTETIYVRGEGGGIHAMDLPLPEPIEERLRKGMLARVNEDGSPYTGDDEESRPLVPESGQQTEAPPLTQPAKAAAKADWVGWAVVCGADPEEADGMTKADLIEKYGTPQPGE
jgi:hypothetical protein